MHWTVWVALLLGFIVLCISTSFGAASETVTDESMKWEGIVALSCGLGVLAGPVWFGQLIFTIAGSLNEPQWRWRLCAWLFFVFLPLVPGINKLFAPLHWLLTRLTPARKTR